MGKFVITLIWALLLGVFTCTGSIDALLDHAVVSFRWVSHPHFTDLLITNDAHVTDPHWLFIKSGHFVGFGILDILLYHWLANRKLSAWLSVLYAISTEILQLYFGRDGRLLDMGIDSAGVWLFYYLEKTLLRYKRVRSLG